MELVNKVAESGIITLDLENYLPKQEIVELDISTFLFKGLLLKEKDFRQAVKEHDWKSYEGKIMAVYCSTDAIVAQWAYMLIASVLEDHGIKYYFGEAASVRQQCLIENIQSLSADDYLDKRIVIKGCGKEPLPDAAFLEVTKRLRPAVKSLMFGEPCSTVPVYKKK